MAANKVEISSAAHFAQFRDRVNAGETALDALLTANIDLSELAENWTPIGRRERSGPDAFGIRGYGGAFDGGGHTVSGLVTASGEAVPFLDPNGNYSNAAGLFGVLAEGAVVRNLTILCPKVNLLAADLSYSVAGGVAGFSAGTLENCRVEGDGVLSGQFSAGGLVGWNIGEIKESAADGAANITGGSSAGGIAGVNGGLVARCAASETAAITAGGNAGGITGVNDRGCVAASTAQGIASISSTLPYSSVGGIIGHNIGGVVENNTVCEVRAIFANGYAGGVVGWDAGGNVTNNSVDEVGSIIADSAAGGVAGVNAGGEISHSAVRGIGKISASIATGGIVGRNDGNVANSAAHEVEHIDAGCYAGGVIGLDDGGTMTACTADDACDVKAGCCAGAAIGWSFCAAS